MTRLLPFLLLSCLSFFTFGQYEIITITESQQPEEPTIMLDYNDPSRMMAAVNIDNAFYSSDSGRTWNLVENNTSEYGIWGDPVLICDNQGSFYYFHLSNADNWIDRIVCQRKDDFGEGWATDTHMGLNGDKAQDKQWATIDRSNGTIYVTWTEFDDYGSTNSNDSSRIMFSKSIDRGETWSDAKQINEVSGDCIDEDNTTEGAVPCVGPNGEVYVAWAGPEGIVFDRSIDGGETWLDEDIFVDEMPGGWEYSVPGIMRCNGLPVTKCDTSGGEHHGTIYINWTDQRNGEDDTDVWLAKSTDGGDTWSEPIRVNDDPAGRHQFFTWMDIDQTNGKLYFVFYDRRNTTENYTDVYIAVSEDGGETFTNIQINETPFNPFSSIFFGDYTNIVAHDGIIRPIWTRLQGYLLVRTALINENVHTAIDDPQDLNPHLQVYPNPVSERGKVAFKLKRPSQISLVI